MFLSIVIPVYNVQDYLRETVESIIPQLSQVEGGCEILLVNDGSTDQSGSLCDRLAAEYAPHIRVFHKENEGLLLTRRYGFLQAQGEYILNCDSDDTLEPDALSVLSQQARTTGADVVLYNIYFWTDTDKQPFSAHMFPEGAVSRDAVRRAMFTEDGAVHMGGKLIRRSCLDLGKDYSAYFRKSTGEDTLQSIEVYSRAESFVYCDRQLYNYRIGSGMTSKANVRYFDSFVPICRQLECCKDSWQLEDFDSLMAQKVFAIAARAMTQSRYDRHMSFRARKSMLQSIFREPLFQDYAAFYPQLKDQLKGSYRLLLGSLLKERYWLIHLSLKLKNLLSK